MIWIPSRGQPIQDKRKSHEEVEAALGGGRWGERETRRNPEKRGVWAEM